MNKLWFALALLAYSVPLVGQPRVDLFIDAEGVRRTGANTDFTPGVTRFEPQFNTGGGVGGGVNWFISDRVSLETKIAGLGSKVRVRMIGSDFIGVADLGWAQIYPISAVVQWHLVERGAVRPYIGAGAAHIILRNINKPIGPGASGIRFKDPTGLVLDGGLEINLGKRWGLYGDARYVPMETTSRATFTGTASGLNLSVRPLIVSVGLGYRLKE